MWMALDMAVAIRDRQHIMIETPAISLTELLYPILNKLLVPKIYSFLTPLKYSSITYIIKQRA